MYIEQIYSSCLSEASYYIESSGEAAIIDPMRDIDVYLEIAEKRSAKIKYVFETHFHSDFVSGHIDLAGKTKATIIFGPGAEAGYNIYNASDGEEFVLGNNVIKVLHTPGHTLESCCFLLLDERHNPHSVFSGDTLFVDEVGRPDLSSKPGLTKFQLADMLYDSIETKLKPLPNYVVLYPGHGPGSACGKAIGVELHSTMGAQKQSNYALKAGGKEDFIKKVVESLSEPPAYFFRASQMNRNGYINIEEVLLNNCVPLLIDTVKKLVKIETASILDTRDGSFFMKAFIPGSVNIGLKGNFSLIAGSILNSLQKLIIVCDKGRERESVLNLASIGFENVAGYLDGGFEAWISHNEITESIDSISSEDFEIRFNYTSCTLVDVRNQDEWIPGFVAGAKLISLQNLEAHLSEIDMEKECFIYCTSGYRSMVAASLLKKHGFSKVINIDGGMEMLRKTKIPVRQLSNFSN